MRADGSVLCALVDSDGLRASGVDKGCCGGGDGGRMLLELLLGCSGVDEAESSWLAAAADCLERQ